MKEITTIKRGAIALLILFLLMLCIPLLALGAHATGDEANLSSSQVSSPASAPADSTAGESIPTSVSSTAQPAPAATMGSFRILDTSTGNIVTVPDEDFWVGAVAAEMPPTFEIEALRAQAIAAYTYYSHVRQEQREANGDDASQADFSADLSNWQSYASKEQMQQRWGEQFDAYYSRLLEAVDPVRGLVLKSGDSLALTAFHAISSGVTEASADVFGGQRDYLVPVASPGDLLVPGYQTTVELTADEFKQLALAQWPDIQLEGEPQTWVGEMQRTSSGMVTSMQLGSLSVSGLDMRTAFSLRSADFDLVFHEDKFVFTVRGYGHGVGMSQYGANYMAQQGADYREILSWYYPGTQLASAQ
ncbi:MAG TPA: stage II sporulation protein D [Candidatus Gallacutalibacter stercoravium]|nr:stage II sporulation protein D [Candidatus Gallacutalibacter stercoravium]